MGQVASKFGKELALAYVFDEIAEKDFDKIDNKKHKDTLDKIRKIRFGTGEEWEPPQPSSDSRIWRYINLTELLSILERESLWFTDISNFEDPYEGTLPKRNAEDEIQKIAEEFDISKKSADQLHSFIVDSPGIIGYYVNCWNLSSHESAALWEQYIETSQGVAISTTVERLKSSIDSDHSFTFGDVEYIDYEIETIPPGIIPMLYHKRKSFKHENEFRACIEPSEDENSDEGKYVKVDVDVLIDEIYLSPISPDWFESLIGEILKTYGVDCELKKSDLYSDPVY